MQTKTRFNKIGIISLLLVLLLASGNIPSAFAEKVHKNPEVTVQAAQDNNIEWAHVLHDSRDAFYRNPGWATQHTGAVKVGTDVVLRLRAAKNDLTGVKIKLWDNVNLKDVWIDMVIDSSDANYDYWKAVITSPNVPTDYYYSFELKDGTDVDYYGDDVVQSAFEDNRIYQTGGVGTMYESHSGDGDYALVFYADNFTTPDWHKKAVGYQIFIDRFYNGNSSNDPVGDGKSGDVIWWEWDSNGNGVKDSGDEGRIYVNKHKTWNEKPLGGYDYFGGDLQGVEQKLPYLNDLGVDFIWFNPFSQAPDNHGYSVDDYRVLNAYYGVVGGRSGGRVLNDHNKSMTYFKSFSNNLENHGIKIIYDTVINHASAQGLYFQRFENSKVWDKPTGFNVPDAWPNIQGAYEFYYSDYRPWFKFYKNEYNHGYDGWFGFKHIPTIIYENNPKAVEEFVTGPNNIFKFWNSYGVDGFRLDVNHQYVDGHHSSYLNSKIRDTVKGLNPNAVIIGEIWERATQWLTGTMNDGVQNMPFRFNTIDWMLSNYKDSTYRDLMLTIQENYPKQAFQSLWVNLGNHDRTRVLSALNNNTEAVLNAATLQFSYPGVPVIWYGDEIGTTGVGDPGTRATFKWDNQNKTMLNYYKHLIQIRKSFPVMIEGGFNVVSDSAEGVIGFYRNNTNFQNDHALILVNRDKQAKQVTIDLANYSGVQSEVLTDLVNNNQTHNVVNGKLTVNLESQGRMILMAGIPVSQTTSQTPTSTTTSNQSSSFPTLVLGFVSLMMVLIIKIKHNKFNL